MTKLISFLSLSVLFASCANPNESTGGQVSNEEDMLVYGKKIYESQCLNCHGEKGEAKVANTIDLSKCKLDESSIGDLVYHGKGTMPAYKDKLGEPEINGVAKYVRSLGVKGL